MNPEVRTFALHLPLEDSVEACLVPLRSPRAGALVVALKDKETPTFILIADSEAIGRKVECGTPAFAGMQRLVSWCYENLPANWMEGEGPLWCSYHGDDLAFVMKVDKSGDKKIEWMPARWCGPGISTSSDALRMAFPQYANLAFQSINATLI